MPLSFPPGAVPANLPADNPPPNRIPMRPAAGWLRLVAALLLTM